MRVVNIMLSEKAGGIEQASADYCRALMLYGHPSVSITPPGAWINPLLAESGTEMRYFRAPGQWDPTAGARLRKLLVAIRPDVVIAHTSRAVLFCHRAIKDIYPLAAVIHNYQNRRLALADAALAPTHDLLEQGVRAGIPRERCFHIPNMIAVDSLPERNKRSYPPVIGTMGRFVAKKGFDVYIEALAILKERGFTFQAVLGGDGEEKPRLLKLAEQRRLGDSLRFTGWVDDRAAFYRDIDIFCLPSLHEPFGIVLLEAFAYGVPIVTTNTEGPLDIIKPGIDALMVEKGSASALADGLAALLIDEARSNALASEGYVRVKTEFSMESVGRRLHNAVQQIARMTG